MIRALAAQFAAALLAACAAGPDAGAPSAAMSGFVPLQNSGFEADLPGDSRCPPKWGCTMHSDASSFRFFIDEAAPAEGKRSLCIERVGDEPWALATQGLFDRALRGSRLRLSIALRTEGVSIGAGPFVKVQGGSGNTLFHDERLIKGTQGWQRLDLEFTVPADAAVVEVGATLRGPGKLCLDDVRLEIRLVPKSPV
ncbi:MAG: hypothetical protein ACXWAC_05995 [Usitatibacter sp.]